MRSAGLSHICKVSVALRRAPFTFVCLLPKAHLRVWCVILNTLQCFVFQRLKILLKPSEEWGPASSVEREIYHFQPYIYENTFLKRLKMDIRGTNETPWFWDIWCNHALIFFLFWKRRKIDNLVTKPPDICPSPHYENWHAMIKDPRLPSPTKKRSKWYYMKKKK